MSSNYTSQLLTSLFIPETRMHSSRMLTASSLTFSHRILHMPPWQPCMPPHNHACPQATTHTPQQPCTPPPATTHAPCQPHTPHTTMHAPWQPHIPPGNHACPPGNHACPLPTMHPPQPHTPPINHARPPLWTDRHLQKHNLRKLRLRAVVMISIAVHFLGSSSGIISLNKTFLSVNTDFRFQGHVQLNTTLHQRKTKTVEDLGRSCNRPRP